MPVKFANNASTTLSSGIGVGDTSIPVSDGSVFPALVGGDYFYATVEEDVTREIIRVTAVTGNTLTAVRGQDGTSPAIFTAAAFVELRLTNATMVDALAERIAESRLTISQNPPSGGVDQDVWLQFTP